MQRMTNRLRSILLSGLATTITALGACSDVPSQPEPDLFAAKLPQAKNSAWRSCSYTNYGTSSQTLLSCTDWNYDSPAGGWGMDQSGNGGGGPTNDRTVCDGPGCPAMPDAGNGPDDGPGTGGGSPPDADGFETPTGAEIIACALSPLDCSKVRTARAEALEWIRTITPPGLIAHNNQFDAMRHAFWNARMTQSLGVGEAEIWATRHETSSSGPQNEKCMDLYNNAIGRQIGTEVGPNGSISQVQQAVLTASQQGRLRVSPSC